MIKQCKWCGKEFEPRHYSTKYCSDKCRKDFYRKYYRERYKHKNPKLVTCLICGKSFWRRGKQNSKYCSPECASEAHRNLARDYSKRKHLQKKIEACKIKHNDCYDCPEEVGYCRYD